MGKLLVRLTIVIVSVYFVLTYLVAQTMGIDIHSDWYASLFALIIVVYAHSEGKYHCKFLKYSATSLFVCDVLTRLDNYYNFLSVDAHNIIPIAILALGLGTSITLAIRHFYRVIKLNRRKNANNARNTR
jgi:galactitol-specific phosphotransferase system IIC component